VFLKEPHFNGLFNRI